MSDLDKIRNDLLIDSFEKLTNQQMSELLSLHAKGKISVAQLEQIAVMVPHFSVVASEAAKFMAQAAAAAGSSQQVALAEIGKTRDAIVSLASHPKVTENILRLILGSGPINRIPLPTGM